MKPVAQDDKNYNCHACCIASILEIDLSGLPDINPGDYGNTWLEWGRWHDDWNAALRDRFGFTTYDVRFDKDTKVEGYTIGVVESQRLEGSLHSIVCKDGVPVWDPQTKNGRPYAPEEVKEHTLLVPLDPAVLMRKTDV